MASTAQNELLRDIVTAAQRDIVCSLSDNEAGVLSESCITHVDNIVTAAEMTGELGLRNLCSRVLDGVQQTDLGDVDAVMQLGQALVDWTTHLLAFIEDPANEGIHRQLVAIVPEELRDELSGKLAEVTEIENSESDACMAPDDDVSNWDDASDPGGFDLDGGLDDDMDGYEEPDGIAVAADSDNEIFGLLAAEVIEIRPQLNSALASILDDLDPMSGSAKYAEIINRIKIVCSSIGATGLENICDFVGRNINSLGLQDVADRAGAEQCFNAWPDFLLDYLANPLDSQVCLDLLSHLQQEAWPEPCTEEFAHELLEGLAAIPVTSEFGGADEERQRQATVDDVAVSHDDDINPALLDAFFQEAPTTAAEFSECVGELGGDGDVTSIAEAAQRLTHTLKGSANLIGARGIASLSHHLEDVLEYLAKNRLQPPPPLLYTMRESADCIEAMIDTLQGIDAAPPDALRILQDVLDWANRIDNGEIEDFSASAQIEDKPQEPEPQPEAEAYIKDSAKPEDRRSVDRRSPSSDILHVPTTTIDKMFRLAGEVSIAISQVQEHLNRLAHQGRSLREQDNVVQRRRFELENLVGVRSFAGMQRSLQRVAGGAEVFDSLELDQYDEFYTSAHSFIEAVTDSREVALSSQAEITSLEGLFRQHKILNDELQQMIMETRMVPVSTILGRLHRSVRQTCRATNKQANLQVDGAELLMDSEILGRLVDPLTHILRNSIDHGIESEENRKTANKSLEGSLLIRFYQAGNDMIVECNDDGRGLDRAGIRKSAIDKGFADSNRELTDSDLTEMLTQSGFTTRDNVTQISGRGVGLDVVHNAVRALKGTMEVGSSESGGFKVLLRLPLTLISTHALLVQVSNRLLAIPTNSLEQILAPDSGSIRQLGNDLAFEQDNIVYPIQSLGNLLGLSDGVDPVAGEGKPVLLARSGNEMIALIIDQVVNSHDVVVKSLGSYVKEIDGVVGVSILGDGSVVPVLDIPRLLGKTSRESGNLPSSRPKASPASNAAAGLPSVLIVDDSLSVRTSLAELVADAGFNPLLARDGLEAIESLRKHAPVVVLVDLEMPNMNGLELTAHIRADARLRHLPILMITSRTQKKHRDQAAAAGVTEYVTKPYNEDDLSDLIVHCTAQDRAHG